MKHEALSSWQDRQFALDWVSADGLGTFLELPRRLSAAVLAHTRPQVSLVVDIASGPGAFLEVFLEQFPDARGIWTDGSEVMREQAGERLGRFGDRVEFHLAEMTEIGNAGLPTGADAVITSRASHHLAPEQLVSLYRGAADLLAPGGWMVNLDHTGPGEPWSELFKAVRPTFLGPARPQPGHVHTHAAPTLSDQLAALDDAGLHDVGVPWKTFQTVLLMGRKV